jgi:hypothetical protein
MYYGYSHSGESGDGTMETEVVLAECGTVEDHGVMEVEEADKNRIESESETEKKILVYIVNEPEVMEMPSNFEHTITDVRTTYDYEGSDEVEIETREETVKVEIPVDVYDNKPPVECNTPVEGKCT